MDSLWNSNTSVSLSGNQALAIQAEIQKLSKVAVECFGRDDITLALTKFKKAYLLSCSVPEKHIQKVCLFNLGAAYISKEKPKKGLKCLIKSVSKGNAKRDGDLYFNIGIAYDALKDHAKAGKFYEKAINEYGMAEISNISDALIKLAYTFVRTGNLDSAAQAFKLAGKSYQTVQRNEDAATALREAANYMIRSQKFSRTEVLQTLNDSVKLCKGITDSHLLVKLYNHLAIHYAQIEFFTKAASCLKESMRYCSGVNFSNQKMAVLLQNSGAVENAMGEYETSIASHMEAADMFGVMGDRNAQGQCLCNLAYAYSQRQNYDRAEFYYQQALHAFLDAGVLQGQWQASEGMGATHFCQGNKDEAISSYKQALALFVKSKDTSEESRERLLRKLTAAIEYRATHHHPDSSRDNISFTSKSFSLPDCDAQKSETCETKPPPETCPPGRATAEDDSPRQSSKTIGDESTVSGSSTTSSDEDGSPNSSDTDENDGEGESERHVTKQEAKNPVKPHKKIKSRMCSIS